MVCSPDKEGVGHIKFVLPLVEELLTLSQGQDVLLKIILPTVLQQFDVDRCHEIIESHGSDHGFPHTTPVTYLMVLEPKENQLNLLISCDFFMEKIGVTAISKITQSLGSDFSKRECQQLHLITLVDFSKFSVWLVVHGGEWGSGKV